MGYTERIGTVVEWHCVVLDKNCQMSGFSAHCRVYMGICGHIRGIEMERFFNTAGPGKEEMNYMVDPLRRIDYEEILSLIRRERYFVLHAPRQTGKTTSLLSMAKRLNEDGEFACVYVNVEAAQTARDDVNAGIRTITEEIGKKIEMFLGDEAPGLEMRAIFDQVGGHAALGRMLSGFCKKSDKAIGIVYR